MDILYVIEGKTINMIKSIQLFIKVFFVASISLKTNRLELSTIFFFNLIFYFLTDIMVFWD
jgi:hypothetical protein